MSAPAGLSSGSNPTLSQSIWNKVHRYRCLLTKYWWVVLLTLSVALCVTAYFQMNKPPAFASTAKLSINVENRNFVAGGTGGMSTDMDTMIDRQLAILQGSAEVRQNASDLLQAGYPDMPASPVSLDYSAKNTIVTITATGTNPLYTQRYLQATIDGYFNYRRKEREKAQNEGFGNLRGQIDHASDVLKQDNDAIIQYQRQIGIVFGKENETNKHLDDLRQKHDTLQAEYNQLLLMTPEQGIDRSSTVTTSVRGNQGGNGTSGSGSVDLSPTTQIALDLASTQSEYRQALVAIADLKVQLDEFSKDMRDRHPKIVSLKASMESQQRRVNDALAYAAKRIESQRAFTSTQIKDLETQIKAAEPKALEDSMQRAKFDQLTETKRRDEETYTQLVKTYTDASTQVKTTPETISIMESASQASAVIAPWVKAVTMAGLFGLAVGFGILFLIDRLDDRMATVSDFQMHFAEHVLGQIPRDDSADSLELLGPEDSRHQLVESFRNLRSTLLFMPLDGARPKTLLVTSAVPNEGKSTTSSNLALVLAFAGMKTLLIDADLRRGAIHQAFNVPRDPGLTDVLGHNVNWKLAIRTTGVENLHILPRGRNVPQPSEYLLNKATDRLLAELYPLYDYIIIDSSPVLAADDTASLAPKIDATLFVTRMGFTSAKMTKKSLEILYKRQANIPGVILNQVDTSSPEFVYYQYEEYYSPASDENEENHASRKRKVKASAKSAGVS